MLFKKTPWIASLSIAGIVAIAMVVWQAQRGAVPTREVQPPTDPVTSVVAKSWNPPPPLQSARAMKYLEQLCALGSRTTGTKGMIQQQQLLQSHFEKLGGKVVWQSFQHRHPDTGQPVEVKNLIVQWNPDRSERVMLSSHYDTRPFPDRDPKNRFGLFVGANDGGSSTAALMELGHAMKDKSIAIGVDFVFFDAEELVYGDQKGDYFVGSTYFAQQYAAEPPPHRYRSGILLDMIGDKNLQLYFDEASFRYAPELAREVWDIAKGLGIKEFTPRVVHAVRDDHLPLNEIARIPTIDIIDFDYPTSGSRTRGYWHTMADTPDKCSGDSMTKVLAVVLEWLKRQK